MNTLVLAAELLEQIIAHCRAEYPLEACGLVSGVAGRGKRVHLLANAHAEPERRYSVDPEEQLAAFRTMRSAGHELLAIYHSHPHTAAYPSGTDVEFAFYPAALHLIVSMTTEPPDVQLFRIDGRTRAVRSAALTIDGG